MEWTSSYPRPTDATYSSDPASALDAIYDEHHTSLPLLALGAAHFRVDDMAHHNDQIHQKWTQAAHQSIRFQ